MAEQLNQAAFPFLQGSYVSRSRRFDCQRLINMYFEASDIGAGKNGQPGTLFSFPGLNRVQTIGTGPIRGAWLTASAELAFFVSGSKVYQLTSANGIPVEVSGNLLTTSGSVSIADNGQHVLIVDGEYGYTIDLTAPTPALTQVVDPNFYPADTVTYLGGYFILDKKGSSNFFISDIDSIDFPPLNESSALASTDNTVAVLVFNNQLFVFGTRTIEVWVLTGASASAPFERQNGFNTGLSAPFSLVQLANTAFFLGSNEQGDGVVFSMENNSPTRISTHAIEYLLQQQGDLSSCTAFGLQSNGHYFYYLNVPSANVTFVYDLSSKMWYERLSTHVDGEQRRHIGEKVVFLNGEHIVGDYRNGNLYIYDYEDFTENGEMFRRRRVCPHLAAGVRNVFPKTLQLDIEAGKGTLTINPRLALCISRDGGYTFGNPIYAAMGKLGEYKYRARWNRLGYGRDLVFDVRCDDPVDVTFLSAWLDVENGFA